MNGIDVRAWSVDIETWVDNAPLRERGFREAVHIILDGIGHSENLQARMVIKGGLLMAIRYDSSRFTRDRDMSTSDRYVEAQAENLIADFETGLVLADDRLSYQTACRLQSRKVEPKGANRTHHNLTMTIGFADRSSRGAMDRLNAGKSANTVTIDYSFNEAMFDVELLVLDGGAVIRSYSLHYLLAEKMRSLLQQPVRKRNRRQDVYDIWHLLESVPRLSKAELGPIHRMLVESCRSRNIEPVRGSMKDDDVVRMAEKGYADLQADVDEDLPSFDEAMHRVQLFYDSLPWS